MALLILYWMTQQFLYYLLERKFGRQPSLLDFSRLLKHLHMKMLDKFLGWLPASWLEQVYPRAAPPVDKEDHTSRASQGAADPVTNTNYMMLIKRHVLASLRTCHHCLDAAGAYR